MLFRPLPGPLPRGEGGKAGASFRVKYDLEKPEAVKYLFLLLHGIQFISGFQLYSQNLPSPAGEGSGVRADEE